MVGQWHSQWSTINFKILAVYLYMHVYIPCTKEHRIGQQWSDLYFHWSSFYTRPKFSPRGNYQVFFFSAASSPRASLQDSSFVFENLTFLMVAYRMITLAMRRRSQGLTIERSHFLVSQVWMHPPMVLVLLQMWKQSQAICVIFSSASRILLSRIPVLVGVLCSPIWGLVGHNSA